MRNDQYKFIFMLINTARLNSAIRNKYKILSPVSTKKVVYKKGKATIKHA